MMSSGKREVDDLGLLDDDSTTLKKLRADLPHSLSEHDAEAAVTAAAMAAAVAAAAGTDGSFEDAMSPGSVHLLDPIPPVSVPVVNAPAPDPMSIGEADPLLSHMNVPSPKKRGRPKGSLNKTPKLREFTDEERVARENEWNRMLFQMLLYQTTNEDLNIDASDEESLVLNEWIKTQRKQYTLFRKNPAVSDLTEEQVNVLNHLKFPFVLRGNDTWMKMYEQLKDFHLKNGHFVVSADKDPALAHWISYQRRQFRFQELGKVSCLTEERKKLLDDIGFVWKVRARPDWSFRFNELVEYKEKNGNTLVPQHYALNRPLGKWVAKQREQYRLMALGKHTFLTPERLNQLNSIGFVWSIRVETLPMTDEMVLKKAHADSKKRLKSPPPTSLQAHSLPAPSLTPPPLPPASLPPASLPPSSLPPPSGPPVPLSPQAPPPAPLPVEPKIEQHTESPGMDPSMEAKLDGTDGTDITAAV